MAIDLVLKNLWVNIMIPALLIKGFLEGKTAIRSTSKKKRNPCRLLVNTMKEVKVVEKERNAGVHSIMSQGIQVS